MSAESVTLAGRAAIESLMIDTCRVTKAGVGKGPFNATTGQYAPPARITVYEGKCRIQVRSDINSNAVEAVVGDYESVYRTATLQLPVTATSGAIEPDCVATLLTCPLDPSLVGTEYGVLAETKGKTHASHRRFRIREVLA